MHRLSLEVLSYCEFQWDLLPNFFTCYYEEYLHQCLLLLLLLRLAVIPSECGSISFPLAIELRPTHARAPSSGAGVDETRIVCRGIRNPGTTEKILLL